jgi:hypothetical protein
MPSNVFEVGSGGVVLPVFRLEVQVLVIARVGLDVNRVYRVVEAFDMRIMAITGAFEPVLVATVYVYLVIHRGYRERLSVGTELAVCQPVPGVSAKS